MEKKINNKQEQQTDDHDGLAFFTKFPGANRIGFNKKNNCIYKLKFMKLNIA